MRDKPGNTDLVIANGTVVVMDEADTIIENGMVSVSGDRKSVV